jgi:hypothetical protein
MWLMKIIEHTVKVFGQECKLDLMHFDKKDGKEWKRIFDIWKELKLGLRNYKSREPNMPEGLSEVAFCLWSGSARYIKIKGTKAGIAGSFDTFDTSKNRAQQIKACSIEDDLTSFGPKSKWDDLYFMDFYNKGEIDGRFDVYLIPNKYIKGQSLNKKETFSDQQEQKRRPRFGIKKEIIKKYKIKPLASNVKVW